MLSLQPSLVPQRGPELGFRSRFVLAKIGHDLRSFYDVTMNEPVPERLGCILARLDGDASVKIERIDERKRR